MTSKSGKYLSRATSKMIESQKCSFIFQLICTSCEFSSIHSLFLLRLFDGSGNHGGTFGAILGQKIHAEFDDIARTSCTKKVIRASSRFITSIAHLCLSSVRLASRGKKKAVTNDCFALFLSIIQQVLYKG